MYLYISSSLIKKLCLVLYVSLNGGNITQPIFGIFQKLPLSLEFLDLQIYDS